MMSNTSIINRSIWMLSFVLLGFFYLNDNRAVNYTEELYSPPKKLINFTLENQSSGGNVGDFSNLNLKDKITVFNFFFSSCPGPCPRLMSQLKKVKQSFSTNQKIQFVSLTVDPKNDTWEKLQQYRDKLGLEGWNFLKEKESDFGNVVPKIARESFSGLVEITDDGFIHSTRAYILDTNGDLIFSSEVELDDDAQKFTNVLGYVLSK